MRMKNPPHPGRSIRNACLEPLGLSISEGAKILGVTRQALNNVITGLPASRVSARRWLSGSPRRLAARKRRGCECSWPMTLQKRARTAAKSRSTVSTSKNCARRERPRAPLDFSRPPTRTLRRNDLLLDLLSNHFQKRIQCLHALVAVLAMPYRNLARLRLSIPNHQHVGHLL